jgi:hypothetical protein
VLTGGTTVISRPVARLAIAAAVANGLAAALTFFVPDILTGPAVTNGNARGTAIVMLVVGVPTLVAATGLARAGRWPAVVVALGVLAYLAYNDVMYLFATPFNRLFLVYVAAFGLTIYATAVAVLTTDARAVADRLPGLPARGIAAYMWIVVFFNVLIWLKTIVPATFATEPGSFLAGSGTITSPIFVEDLSFWLPAAALLGWLMWNRRPAGILLGGAWLVYGVIEAIGVASDQWFGATADATTPHASFEASQMFLVIAIVGLVPLFFYFRAGVSGRLAPKGLSQRA